jgi:hypothetical protein
VVVADVTAELCTVRTQRANKSAVHVRHPRQQSLTLCGRPVARLLRDDETPRIVGCRDCRLSQTCREDRDARGLPELCWHWHRPWGPRKADQQVRCAQPIGAHAVTALGSPLHDGMRRDP